MSVRLKYHNDNFLLYAGVTKGDYDQILRWPFNLKYKISILDRSKFKRYSGYNVVREKSRNRLPVFGTIVAVHRYDNRMLGYVV